MFKRLMLLFSIVSAFVGLFPFAGGNGSESDPYQVSTLAELQDVGDYLDSHFEQTADIDATDTANWNGGNGFVPIGSGAAPFTGSYDGQGHTITNLLAYRGSSDDVGLFGRTSGATVSNLEVLNCDIRGTSRVGALAGQAIDSTIENCGSSGLITTSWAGGGLIGRTNNSDITLCYSIASVESSGEGDHRGGLIGATENFCYVANCYARGAVEGYDNVGSLVGNLIDTDLVNCYATGHLTYIEDYGGLVGSVGGTCSATSCFWDTQSTGVTTSELGTGKTTSEMMNFYMYPEAGWDMLFETRNGTDMIWDFDLNGNVNNGYPYFAWENGDTYSLTMPNGHGTQSEPYQIDSLYDLWWISMNDWSWNKDFIQTATIYASTTSRWNNGAGFDPIGDETTVFSGSYDGQQHAIFYLRIHRPEENDVGLFGKTMAAEIKDLWIRYSHASGDSRVSPLVGLAEQTTITNCYADGSVDADWSGGGLVGKMVNGTIQSSYSNTVVYGTDDGQHTGGLVGRTDGGTITNCCALGDVYGIDRVGGLVGTLEGTDLSYCYSTGTVDCDAGISGGLVGYADGGSATACLWNTTTSGQSTSPLGTGATTSQMRELTTYHGLGWDFETENVNGTEDVWDIAITLSINEGFPHLSWIDGSAQSLSPPAGTGSSSSPYLIATLQDLWWLSANTDAWTNSSYAKQTADIDASDTRNWYMGAGFMPIGPSFTSHYSGNYNGNHCTIDGLYINRTGQFVGLFGSPYYAYISDLRITNAEIHSSEGSSYAGILGGFCSSADIMRCYTSGTVNSYSSAGGLSGASTYTDFSDSYSDASVSSDCRAGGLVGYVSWESNFNRCYAVGFASGGIGASGLVGSGNAIVQDCFWDTQTTGQTTSSGGGTGLTTAEMQTASTFINAGWDFVGETMNGTEDIWVLLPGQYPTFNDYTPPVITAVSDVPNDQGHRVQLVWSQCELDNMCSSGRYYTVWMETSDRALSCDAVVIENIADFTPPNEDDPHPVILHSRDTYWAWLATIPGMTYPQYAYFATTLVDYSTSLPANAYTSTYQVCYHYESGYLNSDEAIGYSVDNIPPYATRNVHAVVNTGSRNPSISLSWEEVTEGGLNGNSYPEQNGVWYRVYGGETADFACNDAALIATTQNSSLDVDIAGQAKRFFKVVVSDQP